MNDQQVNEYIGDLVRSRGDGLSGIERSVFERFQASNMEAAQLQQELNQVKAAIEQQQARAADIAKKLQSLGGSIQTSADLLVDAERSRRQDRPAGEKKRADPPPPEKGPGGAAVNGDVADGTAPPADKEVDPSA